MRVESAFTSRPARAGGMPLAWNSASERSGYPRRPAASRLRGRVRPADRIPDLAVAIVIGAAPARTSRQGACDDPIDRFSNFTILLLAVRKSDTLTVEIQRDHRPQAETELLHRGFYLAFITPDGPRMSPTKQWDAWDAYLTEKHGLSKKPAFVGMSKGEVNEYTWAGANPDKVSSI